MATGEPTDVQAKAFAPLDLPPERRVGDRLAERMGRMAPPDADPGPIQARESSVRRSTPSLTGTGRSASDALALTCSP